MKLSEIHRSISNLLLTPIYEVYENELLKEVKKGDLPQHIGIILDGNRRYAERRGLPPWRGHHIGSKKSYEALAWFLDLGIKMVTVFAFSIENLSRPKREKEELFRIMERQFYELTRSETVKKHQIRIKTLGDRCVYPDYLLKAVRAIEKETAEYDKHIINVAIGYGGRQDILGAIKKVEAKVARGEIKPEEITEQTISDHLDTKAIPDVDLIIRTGGERRLSNFLLWQSVHKQIVFLDVLWPEIRKIDLLRAIRTWQRRGRDKTKHNSSG